MAQSYKDEGDKFFFIVPENMSRGNGNKLQVGNTVRMVLQE